MTTNNKAFAKHCALKLTEVVLIELVYILKLVVDGKINLYGN